MPNKTTPTRKKKQPCVCAAGVGMRDTDNIPCRCRDDLKGRNAIRAIFDSNGRWLIHWREKDGEEWVGTYRLIPC
jgi:hypothetical protein